MIIARYAKPLNKEVAYNIRVCMPSRFRHIQFFSTLWTVVCQTSQSMEFSRQEHLLEWGAVPFSLFGYLPNPGIVLSLFCLLHWQSGSLPLMPPEKPPNIRGHVPLFLSRLSIVFSKPPSTRLSMNSLLDMCCCFSKSVHKFQGQDSQAVQINQRRHYDLHSSHAGHPQ